MEDNRKTQSLSRLIVAVSAGIFVFGSILGLESNIRPFDRRKIEDTSFEAYSRSVREQYGESIGTYALTLWTYPGAKIGAEIHNYGLP